MYSESYGTISNHPEAKNLGAREPRVGPVGTDYVQ